MKLLDTNGGNTKLKKTSGSMAVYRVAGLSLHPDDILCPARNIGGCAKPCLISAGRGRMRNVIEGRKRKADWFHNDLETFLDQLRKELTNFQKTCQRQGVKPAVRLNVISDVAWEQLGIVQEFPEILFYDYTKRSKRLGKTPSNYRLMFSYSGMPKYQKHVKKALETDAPISVVFRGPMPSTFMGRPVIDGDESDLFNLFAGPVIVGLRAKGAAKTEDSAFIVDTNLIVRAA